MTLLHASPLIAVTFGNGVVLPITQDHSRNEPHDDPRAAKITFPVACSRPPQQTQRS